MSEGMELAQWEDIFRDAIAVSDDDRALRAGLRAFQLAHAAEKRAEEAEREIERLREALRIIAEDEDHEGARLALAPVRSQAGE